MKSPNPEREALENPWRQRVNNAKLRLEFARNYMDEVKQDFPCEDIPASDHHFAHQQALTAENWALKEYHRALRI